ncbi:arsenite efflux transporter metallochaperone ArsD [Dietzia sp. PP-33]|jgi:hypothetical protein|uniref:arsenite efflux transporter metallochaperone ArsD n=1 Tax=Dietzia sp. PP-33 TaxID=2957500 RepID=UPI0029B073BF|nr:arsenite efflux transporter metallochaperone ArsD [Dietzia sp. PP-33]MDX2356364.1 arsenite efflux transporter metallochaperone ArsD [Dietzia sp. PP-33]
MTTTITVFEPALCCSSGVCGPDVPAELVEFSADCDWLAAAGTPVERVNLAAEPMRFASDEEVAAFLRLSGSEGLPLFRVDGVTALTGRYPTRAELARWAGLDVTTPVPSVVGAAPVGADLLAPGDDGCGPSGCC